jgi:hypothetical protein
VRAVCVEPVETFSNVARANAIAVACESCALAGTATATDAATTHSAARSKENTHLMR